MNLSKYLSKPLSWWLRTPLYVGRTTRRFVRAHSAKAKKRIGLPVMARLESGARVRVDLSESIDAQMYFDGGYELAWVRAVTPFARAKTVLDCGANVGAFTFGLAHVAAFIYAFEASPANALRLQETVALNCYQHIQVVERAVSSESKSLVSMYEYHEGGHGNRFCMPTNEAAGVETLCLDDFCDECEVGEVGLLKLDIEGFELKALRGARRLIERHKPAILCEFNEGTLARNGDSCAALWAEFQGLGYKAHTLNTSGALEQFEGAAWNEETNENLLFLPAT